jgi:hypothetical protein
VAARRAFGVVPSRRRALCTGGGGPKVKLTKTRLDTAVAWHDASVRGARRGRVRGVWIIVCLHDGLCGLICFSMCLRSAACVRRSADTYVLPHLWKHVPCLDAVSDLC